MNSIHLRSPADLPQLQAWLDAHGSDHLALDTETTGLDVFVPDFLCGIVCLAHSDGTSVTMDGRDPEIVRSALRAAAAGGRALWAHNAGYDAWVLRRTAKVKLSSLLCSAVAGRVAWPGRRGGHGLKRLRPTTKSAQNALKARWAEVAEGLGYLMASGMQWLPDAVRELPADDEALLAYVVEDTVECARLVTSIATALRGGDHEHLHRDLQVDQALRWIGYEGLAVDQDRLSVVLEKTEADVKAGEEHFGFRVHTGNKARLAWVSAHGIELPPTKKSAEKHAEDPAHPLVPSLSKKDRPQAKVPVEHADEWSRFCASIELANFLPKLRELHEKSAQDGLAHTSILVNSAQTGRMSTRDPGTQNIPAAVKPVLLAKPGMALVSADLSHVEPSIMAAAAGDPRLSELCADPTRDIYEETAAVVWGNQAREREADGRRTTEADALRNKAKVIFLGLGYGMGLPTFAATLGLNPTDEGRAEAAKIRDAALGAYPGLAQWLKNTKALAGSGAQIRTLDGRRLPKQPDKPYVACNHVIQGTAASLFKRMLLATHSSLCQLPSLNGRAPRIWLPVHDEIVVECPDDDAYIVTVAQILTESMTTTIGGVPLWADPQFLGTHWRKKGAPIPITNTPPTNTTKGQTA